LIFELLYNVSSAMRAPLALSILGLTLIVASCTNSPTATTSVDLGQTTLDDFLKNSAYRSWYETGFNAYPTTAEQSRFDSAVAIIRSNFDPATHSVVMAIKPNCGCQNTQLWMPRVMRALDAAGVPLDHISIFVTDSRLAGIDSIKAKYTIRDAPTFIVLKSDIEKGRIEVAPLVDQAVEQALASYFLRP